MKKLVVLHRADSFDDLQVLEHFQSMFVDVKVIPVETSRPYKCVMRNLLKFCYDNKPDVIVGLSDCALFAQQLHGYKKVLFNPVLHINWRMTTVESMQFGGITDFDREHSYIFFADEDSQVNAYNEYSESYKNVVKFPQGLGMQELLETYIRPTVRKLLDEELDKKNIDAVRTYELLAEISCGGRVGRAALLNLEDALDNILAEVATTFYSSYCEVKDIASEGFRKATRDFVFEYEEMPYANYTKYLYERLYDYFEEEVKDKNFMIAANEGRRMTPVEAMTELAYFFTHSLEGTYENTVTYEAGAVWLEIYKKDKKNQDDIACQSDFYDAIPLLVDYDRPELVLLEMDMDEKIKIAVESADFTTPAITKALCWGIYQIYLEEKYHPLYMAYKVLVNDDNTLDASEKGIFINQQGAEDAILDWTTNNRERLLCYVLRIVPRGEQFLDDFVKVAHYEEGEQLVDDMMSKEFVYMPTGFRRKQNFNIGDEVKYICFDGTNLVLRNSCISQLDSNESYGICMSDGFLVPARYAFPIK